MQILFRPPKKDHNNTIFEKKVKQRGKDVPPIKDSTPVLENQVATENKSEGKAKKVITVIADSMVKNFSSRAILTINSAKVRSNPGATTADFYSITSNSYRDHSIITLA